MNYRVVHQKVSLVPYAPKVEEHIYGPYRWKWVAILVANLVLGDWDRCVVQERKQWQS